MQLMSDKNIRYLPVFEGEKLTGIVSINDVVRETIITQQETISQLKDYLHASIINLLSAIPNYFSLTTIEIIQCPLALAAILFSPRPSCPLISCTSPTW